MTFIEWLGTAYGLFIVAVVVIFTLQRDDEDGG